jgi:hypothetical protein
MMEAEKLMPLSVAVRIAGASYWQSWRAVVSGACPAARRGERWYVRPADLAKVVGPQPVPSGQKPAA